MEKLRVAQECDESLVGRWAEAKSVAANFRVRSGVLCTSDNQIVVPPPFIPLILKECHDNWGHGGN